MSEPTRPKGLYCPECKGVRLTVVTRAYPAAGVMVRYRKCSTCGCRIKTREVIVKSKGREPEGSAAT